MTGTLRVYWIYGEKQTLAKRAGISQAYLSEILAGKKAASQHVAERIEEEAAEMGLFLSSRDLMFPHDSDNPLLGTTRLRNKIIEDIRAGKR